MYHPMTQSLEIYTSDKYPEANIIHEILHSILRIEGYNIIGIKTDDFRLTNKHLYLKNISTEISNNLDHLIIDKRIKKYDLDLKLIDKLLNERDTHILKKPRNYISIEQKIIDSITLGIASISDEGELLELLKERYIMAYEYRNKFINIIEEQPFLKINEYKILLIKILKKLKTIYHENVSNGEIDIDIISVLNSDGSSCPTAPV